MKVRPIAATAALLAALGGGAYVTQGPARGPGDLGLHDDVAVAILPASPATLSPTPEDTPTPLEPLANCEREELQHLRPADLTLMPGGLFLDEFGFGGHPVIRTEIDTRIVDNMHIFHKAGTLELYANLEMELHDAEGVLRDYKFLPNLIVNNGKALAIRMLVGDNTGTCPTTIAGGCGNNGTCGAPVKFNYVGIGSNSPVVGDVATQATLSSEFSGGSYARQLDNAPDFTATPGQAKLIVTFGTNNPSAGTVSILESGAFNASSSGTLLARRQFGAVTKNASDTFQLTWTFSLS